jgi:hypothetical protein
MEYNSNEKIYGVVEGVSYGKFDRTDELNDRMASRYFSDSPLQPNYNPRPVPTKYSLFPIIDRKTPVKEVLLPYVDYSLSNNFNPGNAKAPISGFLKNVDTETILRNQAFALQKSDQSVYVPTSQSDLYKVEVISKPMEQPYPLLFSTLQYGDRIHPNNQNKKIGNDRFFNHTRTQLRSV